MVSADSYRAMTTPASLADGTKTRYASRPPDFQPPRAAGHSHGGGISGFPSEVDYYPDSGLSVVVPLNTAGPVGPGELARDIADVVSAK